MHNWLKLSHRAYSGRLQPHEHTSYLPLAFLVVLVGFVLVGFSVSFLAEASPPPQAGSVGLSGVMPEAPPTTAATITSPVSQQHFTTSPITVSGTCPLGTLVEIYKNNIFAGSVPCDTNGKFSVSIDLLVGQNILTAQVLDALNQAGPDSKSVTVFYDALPAQTAPLSILNFTDTQLLLNTDAIFRGVFPGQELNVPINVIGGAAPFAINVQWGDSMNKVIPRSNNLTFNAQHSYQKPGTYEIVIQGSDSQQHVAFLEVAAIVNGQPAVITASNVSSGKPTVLTKLLVLWPIYTIALTLVVSFWLGEQREKRVLKTVNTQVQPLQG